MWELLFLAKIVSTFHGDFLQTKSLGCCWQFIVLLRGHSPKLGSAQIPPLIL
jgi:hypothetical protein